MSIVTTQAIYRGVAATDLTEKEGCFVSFDSNGKLALAAATAKDAIGVIHVGGEADQATDICLPNFAGIVRVKLHGTPGTVKKGSNLVLAGNGTVKTAATGEFVAKALEDGEADALIEAILVTPITLA